jgi:putative RNA 2'-phosphotransferase
LSHHPEKLGLELDEKASADIETLVKALKKRPAFAAVTAKQVERLAASQLSASRFEITGNRIRARYGHSLAQSVQYEPAEPPPTLFHGTTAETAPLILKEGLAVTKKRLVHLSTDLASARLVALRRTPTPQILAIDAAKAAKAGVQFYLAGPTVWLSDTIPPTFVSVAK